MEELNVRRYTHVVQRQRGYGLIQPDGSKDGFVHISAFEVSGLGRLNEGQKVNFDIERGQ